MGVCSTLTHPCHYFSLCMRNRRHPETVIYKTIGSHVPQVAETKIPYLMDVSQEPLLYDEFMVCVCSVYCHRSQGELLMNIEKRDFKIYNIIIIAVLAAILLTAFGGYMLLQTMQSRHGSKGVGGDINSLMIPESTQTSPTGRLVVSTGIALLLLGFGIIALLWLVGARYLHLNPS